MKVTKALSLILLATLIIPFTAARATADDGVVVLKVASLAPKGSSWYKSFSKTKREVKKATKGAVVLKLYGGGVMGDEGAMVRKMRTGQLAGAALTSVGMGEIASEFFMYQMPMTFKNYKEINYVREKMEPKFKEILDKKGFVLLHWGDVGFNYLFSNAPVASPSDMAKTKMWVWDADPVGKAVLKVSGANAVQLGVPDVLPSLSTGVIDAFSNSPYGAVALQWHTKAKYVTDLKVAFTIGGLLLSKKAWDKIPAEHQASILEISKKNGSTLLNKIRKDNKKAIKTIVGGGVESVKAKDIKEWKNMAKKVEKVMVGKHFSAELLAEMKKHLKAIR